MYIETKNGSFNLRKSEQKKPNWKYNKIDVVGS